MVNSGAETGDPRVPASGSPARAGRSSRQGRGTPVPSVLGASPVDVLPRGAIIPGSHPSLDVPCVGPEKTRKHPPGGDRGLATMGSNGCCLLLDSPDSRTSTYEACPPLNGRTRRTPRAGTGMPRELHMEGWAASAPVTPQGLPVEEMWPTTWDFQNAAEMEGAAALAPGSRPLSTTATSSLPNQYSAYGLRHDPQRVLRVPLERWASSERDVDDVAPGCGTMSSLLGHADTQRCRGSSASLSPRPSKFASRPSALTPPRGPSQSGPEVLLGAGPEGRGFEFESQSELPASRVTGKGHRRTGSADHRRQALGSVPARHGTACQGSPVLRGTGAHGFSATKAGACAGPRPFLRAQSEDEGSLRAAYAAAAVGSAGDVARPALRAYMHSPIAQGAEGALGMSPLNPASRTERLMRTVSDSVSPAHTPPSLHHPHHRHVRGLSQPIVGTGTSTHRGKGTGTGTGMGTGTGTGTGTCLNDQGRAVCLPASASASATHWEQPSTVSGAQGPWSASTPQHGVQNCPGRAWGNPSPDRAWGSPQGRAWGSPSPGHAWRSPKGPEREHMRPVGGYGEDHVQDERCHAPMVVPMGSARRTLSMHALGASQGAAPWAGSESPDWALEGIPGGRSSGNPMGRRLPRRPSLDADRQQVSGYLSHVPGSLPSQVNVCYGERQAQARRARGVAGGPNAGVPGAPGASPLGPRLGSGPWVGKALAIESPETCSPGGGGHGRLEKRRSLQAWDFMPPSPPTPEGPPSLPPPSHPPATPAEPWHSGPLPVGAGAQYSGPLPGRAGSYYSGPFPDVGAGAQYSGPLPAGAGSCFSGPFPDVGAGPHFSGPLPVGAGSCYSGPFPDGGAGAYLSGPLPVGAGARPGELLSSRGQALDRDWDPLPHVPFARSAMEGNDLYPIEEAVARSATVDEGSRRGRGSWRLRQQREGEEAGSESSRALGEDLSHLSRDDLLSLSKEDLSRLSRQGIGAMSGSLGSHGELSSRHMTRRSSRSRDGDTHALWESRSESRRGVPGLSYSGSSAGPGTLRSTPTGPPPAPEETEEPLPGPGPQRHPSGPAAASSHKRSDQRSSGVIEGQGADSAVRGGSRWVPRPMAEEKGEPGQEQRRGQGQGQGEGQEQGQGQGHRQVQSLRARLRNWKPGRKRAQGGGADACAEPDPAPLPSPGAGAGPSTKGKAKPAAIQLFDRGPWLKIGYRDVRGAFQMGPVLGEGQFGVIRVVEERFSGRQLACKSILKAKSRCDDVQKEFRILQALRGLKHVPRLEDTFEDAQEVHFVMELCKGGELFDRVRDRKRYTDRKAAAVMRTILEVLSFCHARGIVHRDIKPENVLLCSKSSDTACKVIDFGIATFHKPGSKPMDEFVGSPLYMAPEVIEGSGYDAKADMWSAGVVLFVLLQGRQPFKGRTDADILAATREAKLQFSRSVPISECAKDLIARLLCRNPGKRLSAKEALGHPWFK